MAAANALLDQLTGHDARRSTASNRSPGVRHCRSRPVISTGVEGPASSRQLRPLSLRHDADAAHGGTGNDDIALSAGCRSAPEWWQWGPGPCPDGPRSTAPLARRLGLAFSSMHLGCPERRSSSRSSMPMAGLGRDRDADADIAAPVLGDEAVLGQAASITRSGFAVGLSILLIATIIGNICSLGVVDGLDGLGHDAVVGGNHQNGDIGARWRRGHAWR